MAMPIVPPYVLSSPNAYLPTKGISFVAADSSFDPSKAKWAIRTYILLMRASSKALGNLHACLAQVAELGHELVLVVQRNNVVGAANADAIDQDVWHGSAARLLLEVVLEMRAERVLVNLDDKGLGRDGVLFEEDALGALRIRAVCLGEDDD